MESETGSFLRSLLNFPFTLGLNSANPPQEAEDQATHGESRDRVILINPLSQSVIIMERNGGSTGLESLFRDLLSRKSGQRPAAKGAIDAMPSVEIGKGENCDEQCVVCLEEWGEGERAKEMPCKHRFHGDCIEKWLKINGCCPICRYEMPVDEDASRKTRQESDGERRGIWVSFDFGGDWTRLGDNQNQYSSNESRENSDSSSDHQEIES